MGRKKGHEKGVMISLFFFLFSSRQEKDSPDDRAGVLFCVLMLKKRLFWTNKGQRKEKPEKRKDTAEKWRFRCAVMGLVPSIEPEWSGKSLKRLRA